MSEPLGDLDDEELGRLVRNTAAFRAAAACAEFADEAQELRKNDALAFARSITETHQQQETSVGVRATTATVVAASMPKAFVTRLLRRTLGRSFDDCSEATL